MLGRPDPREDSGAPDEAPAEVWVRLPAELDIASAGILVDAVREIPGTWPVIVDVRRLEFVDVAGAAELVQALELASVGGRRVVIRGPFAPHVAHVLELTDGLISLHA